MKYRKKPVVIDAIQWTGKNYNKIKEFMGESLEKAEMVELSSRKWDLVIHTLEGRMAANEGDWIIKGVEGEFYPCKDGIFKQTYEKVE